MHGKDTCTMVCTGEASEWTFAAWATRGLIKAGETLSNLSLNCINSKMASCKKRARLSESQDEEELEEEELSSFQDSESDSECGEEEYESLSTQDSERESECDEEESESSSAQNRENKSKCGEKESKSSNDRQQRNTNGPMTVCLTEPNVLDCDICFEPLTSPVFQCKNGHIACDQCCKKLKNNKCPSCKLHIGSIRCRAIENILESIRVSCQNTYYGCYQTSMPYILKRHHDATCVYSPCPCPFANCDYQSSAKQLSLHLNKKHPDRLRHSFKYDSTFSIKLDRNAECIILKEDKEGDLFAITIYMNDSFGRAVVVSHIIGTTVQRRHPYELTAKIIEPDEGISSTLKIQSFTRNHVPRRSGKSSSCRTPPSAGTFLVIPKHTLGSGLRQLILSLCIHPSV